jgi:lipoate-protein ligase A
MLRETGSAPDNRQLGDALVKRYEPILGAMTLKTEPDADLVAKADELQAERCTDEWLFANDRRRPDARQVKIREGVYVIQNMFKAPGGLIRVTAVNEDGVLRDVHLSGDFFFYPAENLPKLEASLNGVSAQTEAVSAAIEAFYAQNTVETPGVLPADFARALIPA